MRKKQKILTHPSQEWKSKLVRNIPANKSPGPDGFMAEFYQKIQRRANTYPTQTLSENYRGRKTPKLIL